MKKEDEVKLNDDGVTLEKVMADDFPRIYLHRMKDNPDGSCTMTFDTNKAFDNLYKKDKGRKRATEKGIGNYVLEILQKGVDKEDGYEIRKSKDTSEQRVGEKLE